MPVWASGEKSPHWATGETHTQIKRKWCVYMGKVFTLPDSPQYCAVVRSGRELAVTELSKAKELCAADVVKRMGNKITVPTTNYGPQELPCFRKIERNSSRLSSRMSPPAGKPKGSLTTRKIGNSAYVNLIEHGVSFHTKCTLVFWRKTFPIVEDATFDGEYFNIPGEPLMKERVTKDGKPEIKDGKPVMKDGEPLKFKISGKKFERGEKVTVFRSRTTKQVSDPRIPLSGGL